VPRRNAECANAAHGHSFRRSVHVRQSRKIGLLRRAVSLPRRKPVGLLSGCRNRTKAAFQYDDTHIRAPDSISARFPPRWSGLDASDWCVLPPICTIICPDCISSGIRSNEMLAVARRGFSKP
jgi:hypothetical protein